MRAKRSVTTSIRLSADLRARLDRFARRRRSGRNRVIVEALEKHLGGEDRAVLREEARRQSLQVGTRMERDKVWEAVAEADPWPNR